MNILVTGGSASGKSGYAEALAQRLGGPLCYIATMRPWDDECLRRIEKHRLQRAGKGFETVECYGDLTDAALPARGTALLECMGNLTANVLFGDCPPPDPEEAVWRGICHVGAQCEHLVVVTNEVFSDGRSYDAQTTRYLQLLARLNSRMGRDFDRVVEVVCGIALAQKGDLL